MVQQRPPSIAPAAAPSASPKTITAAIAGRVSTDSTGWCKEAGHVRVAVVLGEGRTQGIEVTVPNRTCRGLERALHGGPNLQSTNVGARAGRASECATDYGGRSACLE
jgi:hypothetical protein